MGSTRNCPATAERVPAIAVRRAAKNSSHVGLHEHEVRSQAHPIGRPFLFIIRARAVRLAAVAMGPLHGDHTGGSFPLQVRVSPGTRGFWALLLHVLVADLRQPVKNNGRRIDKTRAPSMGLSRDDRQLFGESTVPQASLQQRGGAVALTQNAFIITQSPGCRRKLGGLRISSGAP